MMSLGKHYSRQNKKVYLLVVITLFIAPNVKAVLFQGLGDLPGGGFASVAEAVSADGNVVVGQSLSARTLVPFRWTSDGNMVELGVSQGRGILGRATGVSHDGSVVVGNDFIPGQGHKSFRWTSETGITDLDNFNSRIATRDLSANGNVVVGSRTTGGADGQEAISWMIDSGIQGLGRLPGHFSSFATAVSTNGSVVVGDSRYSLINNLPSHPANTVAFRWTEDKGMMSLGVLPGGHFTSSANSVSADGRVVVGSSATAGKASTAFRWTEDNGMIALNDDRDFISSATAVSADGSVVVGWRNSSSTGNDVFFWDAVNGMRSLMEMLIDLGADMDGWVLGLPKDISADGLTIVGDGTDPKGRHQAWIARLVPVPIPSAILLFATGLIGLRLREYTRHN